MRPALADFEFRPARQPRGDVEYQRAEAAHNLRRHTTLRPMSLVSFLDWPAVVENAFTSSWSISSFLYRLLAKEAPISDRSSRADEADAVESEIATSTASLRRHE